MKVLSVASEVYPLIKTGGLADVAGALPAALAAHGVEMRTLLPGYPKVMAALGKMKPVLQVDGGQVLFGTHAGLTLYVLDVPTLFDRDGGPYGDADGQDWDDNATRFAQLSMVAARLARGEAGWQPDVVHAHDWQAALVPVYLRYAGGPPSVLTIHNIAFQGRFTGEVFGELDLPQQAWSVDGVEYYNDVSYLKGGLASANAITTVSPTYAREILTPHFGMGMQDVIAPRAHLVHGIVNGIDTDVWNPEADPTLEQSYTPRTLARRRANRTALEAQFGLEQGGPLFCVISRLTWQKGLDLLADNIDHLVGLGGKLIVLGSGEPALEDAFTQAAARHPGRVATFIGYDEALSHRLQGGSDAILIPSRFEPCGLTQLYGLRYGCVPIVACTGGLADTIVDANGAALRANVATGLLHAPDSGPALGDAIADAVALYQTPAWVKMQRNGMRADVGWQASAGEYAALYRDLTS
ncbi:starch synthase [Monaibacterium marinum]|uniref:Glycogen synthase n=1 Tax=Pontivivens marinum TaxID=1690039 RepID=A0A2C9CRM8_9RHOB|nr:glycogen synthase GlgA [Monaibacterium marinum]SOH94006.1 starch synthase [Monaibacterium marinum]